VYAHSYQVMIGVGSKESFTHSEHEFGDPPNIVSLGESNIDGALTYYQFDNYHTEIPRRYLISIEKARDIMRKWIITGDRPLDAK